jgi:hypothetical protein
MKALYFLRQLLCRQASQQAYRKVRNIKRIGIQSAAKKQ